MIFVGVGSNVLMTGCATLQSVCQHGLSLLVAEGVRVCERSRWYRSAPVPLSSQPWFVNGVVRVETSLSPVDLLLALHRVEARMGRVRKERNEARIIDMDVLDYQGLVVDEGLILPHPRLHERGFVLYPLQDIAPHWRHPKNGKTIEALLRDMPKGQKGTFL